MFRHAYVAVLNAAFCITCSLLLLVVDARGAHMEEPHSRAGLMTVSFCIPILLWWVLLLFVEVYL